MNITQLINAAAIELNAKDARILALETGLAGLQAIVASLAPKPVAPAPNDLSIADKKQKAVEELRAARNVVAELYGYNESPRVEHTVTLVPRYTYLNDVFRANYETIYNNLESNHRAVRALAREFFKSIPEVRKLSVSADALAQSLRLFVLANDKLRALYLNQVSNG